MKQTRPSLLMTLTVLTTLVFSSMRLQAADAVKSERLLPPNVLAYLSIPSIPALHSGWQESHWGKLQNEPELVDFLEQFQAQLDIISQGVEKETGTTLNNILKIPSGEIALAVLQLPPNKFAAVGILDFGEKQRTLEILLTKLKEANEAKGAKLLTEEIDGTTIHIISEDNAGDATDAPQKPEPFKKQFAYFLKDTLLVAGNDTDALKAVLARWDGKHDDTFADNKEYKYLIEQCKTGEAEPLVKWYIDPIGMLTSAVSVGGQQNMQAQMFMGFLPALGISKIKGIGGAFELGTEDFSAVSKTMIYVDLPASGLLNVFQFPATDLTPPKWVSAQTSDYYSVNWNVSGAYDAVEGLVDSFQGPGTVARLLDQLSMQEGGPGLHLKKDILDQLSGRINVIQDYPNPDESDKRRILVGLKVNDVDAVKASLSKVAALPQFPGKVRDFKGTQIYEIPAELMGQVGGNNLGITIASENLMISSDVTLLEQILLADRTNETLADTKEFKRFAKFFPEKTSMLSFQKQNVQLKTAYDMLRSGDLGQNVEDVDFSKLPPFDVIKKYLKPSGSYTEPNERGVIFTGFQLKD